MPLDGGGPTFSSLPTSSPTRLERLRARGQRNRRRVRTAYLTLTCSARVFRPLPPRGGVAGVRPSARDAACLASERVASLTSFRCVAGPFDGPRRRPHHSTHAMGDEPLAPLYELGNGSRYLLAGWVPRSHCTGCARWRPRRPAELARFGRFSLLPVPGWRSRSAVRHRAVAVLGAIPPHRPGAGVGDGGMFGVSSLSRARSRISVTRGSAAILSRSLRRSRPQRQRRVHSRAPARGLGRAVGGGAHGDATRS